jgi:type VI secretion system secreted protein VgrG
MEITTPLGDDVLLFHAMHAHEELGRVGECRLELLSLKNDIDLDQILGKNVTVSLALQDDTTRYFNGYVTRFSEGGTHGRYRRYYATVNTWAWFLSRTADCRIFQEMTVPDIVKQVFSDHPMALFKDELTGSYSKWTYCVQYRETDLNFVTRLMEEEGIYFYFTHEDGKHTLVMADSYSGHEACQGDPIPFIAPDDLARHDIEHVSAWTLTREVQPGLYVHDDFDFERPSVELRTQKAVLRQYALSDYEVYDFPGFYLQKADGESSASTRIDEYAAQFETAQAATNCKQVRAGALFKLDKCPRADQNREHLIVSATYDLEFSDYEAMPDRGGAEYQCSFVAMSSQQQFRPRRLTPKPFVQGPQTAVVVGPAGDEIYTDKYGRVKVLFHWDRLGEQKKDENCSCWIRVSHPWAGKGWGSVSTPRIGQEVIVDFLEGDPDQPIITGRVYNAECQPPFGFPAGAVISGHKSQTHKGSGYNEISCNDTAGKEKITIHAQYDMDTTVLHDQTCKVTNNRTTNVDVDDKETIGANQKVNIGVDHTLDIGSNDKIAVGAAQDLKVGANQTIAVGANRTITITANEEVSAGANMKHSAAANLDLSAGVDLSAVAGVNVKVSGGATVDVAAGATIKLSAAGSSIEIGPAGIKITSGALVTVMGSMIKLN